MPGKKTVLAGTRFGRLTTLVTVTRVTNKKIPCVCDCGTEQEVPYDNMRAGSTVSCGCYRRTKNITHGASKSTEHEIYHGMRKRCNNPNALGYERYGGRGIRVCERWESDFANFLADMGPRPSLGHSIDRIDNDGPYSPENCRWASRTEQNRNTRSNRPLTIDGVTKTLSEWAEMSGIMQQIIGQRIDRLGWDTKRAVWEEVRPMLTLTTRNEVAIPQVLDCLTVLSEAATVHTICHHIFRDTSKHHTDSVRHLLKKMDRLGLVTERVGQSLGRGQGNPSVWSLTDFGRQRRAA